MKTCTASLLGLSCLLAGLLSGCGAETTAVPTLIVDVVDAGVVVVDVEVSVEGVDGVVDCDAELARFLCAAPPGPSAIVIRRDGGVIGVVDTVVGDGIATAVVDLSGG